VNHWTPESRRENPMEKMALSVLALGLGLAAPHKPHDEDDLLPAAVV